MFRRTTAGLPEDPVYPSDLTGLGYFINEDDEIRNIKDQNSYFKFFLTKNDRYNIVQREAMNEAIRNEIHNRLTVLGLSTINLPLGATQAEPHVPIYITSNLSIATRVIILFYEPSQDLGVFAHRIIGSSGGINAGSAVNLVKYIQAQQIESTAIILANTGQLRWSRHHKKALTQVSWIALPAKSAVSPAYRIDPIKNAIPGNLTPLEHVSYVFNEVVEKLVSKKAKINVIAVSDSAMQVCTFLSQHEGMYEKWCASERISAFAAVATYWLENDFIQGDARFAEWYRDHAHAYITSPSPEPTFLAGPKGNRKIPAYGTNTYSLGEPYYSECLLPKGYKAIIDWFEEVAKVGSGYKNKVMEKFVEYDDDEGETLEEGWGGIEGMDGFEPEVKAFESCETGGEVVVDVGTGDDVVLAKVAEVMGV